MLLESLSRERKCYLFSIDSSTASTRMPTLAGSDITVPISRHGSSSFLHGTTPSGRRGFSFSSFPRYRLIISAASYPFAVFVASRSEIPLRTPNERETQRPKHVFGRPSFSLSLFSRSFSLFSFLYS